MAIDINAETKKKINVSRLKRMLLITPPASNLAKMPLANKLVLKEQVIEIVERIVAESKDE